MEEMNNEVYEGTVESTEAMDNGTEVAAYSESKHGLDKKSMATLGVVGAVGLGIGIGLVKLHDAAVPKLAAHFNKKAEKIAAKKAAKAAKNAEAEAEIDETEFEEE